MFQSLDVFRTAIAMARHAGAAQAASAQNIANADTPGYRGVELPAFADTLQGVPRGTQLQDGMRSTRPGHLGRDSQQALHFADRRRTEDPNGNSVSLESEMLAAVDAQRAHQRALTIYRSNLMLLRSSLGN